MRAAVLWERRTPLAIEDLQAPQLGPGEVRVRVLASGICHSDVHHIRRETRSVPPLVLGHEAAGVVVEAAPGVQSVRPGSRAIIAWGAACGACVSCVRGEPFICEGPRVHRRCTRDGREITPLYGVGAFAEEVTVEAHNVVPIPDTVPAASAALIACAVATGVGAVLNTARVTPGSSVAVIGTGGVGLSVVQGAHLAGAARIVAVDRSAAALERAARFGATDLVRAADDDPVAQVRELAGGRGVDYAFEVVGRSDTILQACAMTRPGGTTVVLGVAAEDDLVALPAVDFVRSPRSLVGSSYGSTVPQRDFPRYVALYLAGRLKVDELIERRYRLEEINAGIDALSAGASGRGVVVFDG